MDGTSPDKLGFKRRMVIFSAPSTSRPRATTTCSSSWRSPQPMSRRHRRCWDDLATLRQKRRGMPQHNAGRCQRSVNRALDRALWCAEAGPHHETPREGARLMTRAEAPQRTTPPTVRLVALLRDDAL
jgi:hypothetical protein